MRLHPAPLMTDTVAMHSIQVFVKNPILHITWDYGQYTSYAIYLETNNVAFTYPKTLVRRRYSEFTRLRKMLKEQHPTLEPPRLPSKSLFSDKFSSKFIHQRREGLETFLDEVLQNHLYLSNRSLHLFIQSNLPMEEIESTVYGLTKKQIKSEPHLILCPCPVFDFDRGSSSQGEVSMLHDLHPSTQLDSAITECTAMQETQTCVTIGSRLTVCSPALEVPKSGPSLLPDISEDDVTSVGSMDSDYSSNLGNSSPWDKCPVIHGILQHRTPSSQNSSASGSPVRKKKVSFNSEVTVAHLFTE